MQRKRTQQATAEENGRRSARARPFDEEEFQRRLQVAGLIIRAFGRAIVIGLIMVLCGAGCAGELVPYFHGSLRVQCEDGRPPGEEIGVVWTWFEDAESALLADSKEARSRLARKWLILPSQGDTVDCDQWFYGTVTAEGCGEIGYIGRMRGYFMPLLNPEYIRDVLIRGDSPRGLWLILWPARLRLEQCERDDVDGRWPQEFAVIEDGGQLVVVRVTWVGGKASWTRAGDASRLTGPSDDDPNRWRITISLQR